MTKLTATMEASAKRLATQIATETLSITDLSTLVISSVTKVESNDSGYFEFVFTADETDPLTYLVPCNDIPKFTADFAVDEDEAISDLTAYLDQSL